MGGLLNDPLTVRKILLIYQQYDINCHYFFKLNSKIFFLFIHFDLECFSEYGFITQ